MDFKQLFKEVSSNEIGNSFNIFKLVGDDFFIITSGDENDYNSMVGSGGGFGVLFKKTSTWCVMRSDRYTLEKIEVNHTYTLSYFPKEYREQMMFLGSKSGRNSAKMKETKLKSIKLPSGNISFEEADLIIECKLIQSTIPKTEDFYDIEAKEYLKAAYTKASNHRKYVFGEITGVWIKK